MGGVTLNHQIDHPLLTVGEAVAQVTAEAEATADQDHHQRGSEVLRMRTGH